MRKARGVVLLLIALQATLLAQRLSDSDVERAIKAGQEGKFSHLVSDCIATAGWGESISGGVVGGIQPTGSFYVVLTTNPGRIANLAANAKRLYKPFGMADVSDDLRNPAVFVLVEPQKPSEAGGAYKVPSMIDRVVLKSKSSAGAFVQPKTFETEEVAWGNLMGGKVSSNRASASFPYEAVRNLPGEFDIIVVTQAGERRCKVGGKDRAKLF